MNINPVILRALNKNLGVLLISINQYFLHARTLKHWGFSELGEAIYKKSIGDMKAADDVIERILLLGGLPNLQELGKLLIGEDVPEIIACDLTLETQKHETLTLVISQCEVEQDYVSRNLLSAQLEVNEEYIDWLETEQELIESMGLMNYLQASAEE